MCQVVHLACSMLCRCGRFPDSAPDSARNGSRPRCLLVAVLPELWCMEEGGAKLKFTPWGGSSVQFRTPTPAAWPRGSRGGGGSHARTVLGRSPGGSVRPFSNSESERANCDKRSAVAWHCERHKTPAMTLSMQRSVQRNGKRNG